jgi:hypothetical protein
MYQLNLPPFDYKVKAEAQRKLIFDAVRRKYVALTPEEWVRQHVIHFLITEKNVPQNLIGVEKGLTILGRTRRVDVVVFDRNGQPALLVECKAPTVAINPQVYTQAAVYTYGFGIDYIMLTNGINHHYLQIDKTAQRVEEVVELPAYPFQP